MHIFLCTVSAQTLLMTPSSRRRNRARSSSHLRTNRTGKYRGVAHGAVLGLCAEGESSRQSASTASRKTGPARKSLVKYVDLGGVIGSERGRVVLVTVDVLNHDREDAKVPGAEAT